MFDLLFYKIIKCYVFLLGNNATIYLLLSAIPYNDTKICVILRILKKFTEENFLSKILDEVCKVFNWNKYNYYL